MVQVTKVPLKVRIGLWYLARRLRKEFKMKPLPKWVGWVAILLATFGTGGAMAGLIPIKIAAMLATGSVWLSNLTHSLPGTGGK